MSKQQGAKRPIVIRREEVVEGGHHGGAWKVAYADFVTAMMAFFLLMWLLNATTDEQRRGLADYFSPMNPLARGASGTGRPFGGKTPFETGEMVSDRGTMAVVQGRSNEQPVPDDPVTEISLPHTPSEEDADEPPGPEHGVAARGKQGGHPGDARDQAAFAGETAGSQVNPASGQTVSRLTASPDARMLALIGTKTPQAAEAAARAAADEAALRADQDRREKASFEQTARTLRETIRGDKLLEEISSQVAIDQTPEGLRVQLLDEDRRPMFALGSATMEKRAQLLLARMAPVLAKLPEPIAISGHTDAAPYRGTDRSNWDLSAERANTTRRLLVEGGLPETHIRSVAGNADRDLLLPGDPLAAANRRIAILVLRTSGSGQAGGAAGATPGSGK